MLYSTIPVKYNVLLLYVNSIEFSDNYFILQSKADFQFWKISFLCLCVANFERRSIEWSCILAGRKMNVLTTIHRALSFENRDKRSTPRERFWRVTPYLLATNRAQGEIRRNRLLISLLHMKERVWQKYIPTTHRAWSLTNRGKRSTPRKQFWRTLSRLSPINRTQDKIRRNSVQISLFT